MCLNVSHFDFVILTLTFHFFTDESRNGGQDEPAESLDVKLGRVYSDLNGTELFSLIFN